MRIICLLAFSFAVVVRAAAPTDPVYGPLWLYQGTWHVSPKNLAAGAKPDELKNECALVGKYFACQQTVDGKTGALLIFIPSGKPGHYYTQNVMPEGRASGRGDLEISGDQWIYSSTWDAGGKTIYYKTTNLFTGKNHIHFEQSESNNGKEWTVKNSGEEMRVSTSGH